MPESAFSGYLDAALRFRGVDPDAHQRVVGAPPPEDGAVTLDPAVAAVVKQYLSQT